MDWQYVLVGIALGLAIGFLLRKFLFKGKGGSCDSCNK